MSTILGTVNLNGCNYQLKYDLLSQDPTTNSSVVRFYGVLDVTNNYVAWSRGTASAHTHSATIGTRYNRGQHILVSADFRFFHNDVGKFSAWIGASLSTTFVSGDCGGILTLPQIARASSITVPEGTINKNLTITVHSASSEFRHILKYEFGNSSGKIADDVLGGAFKWLVPSELYSEIPNERSGVGTITVDTYFGRDKIGTNSTELRLFADENECKPEISVSVIVTDMKSFSLTGNRDTIIRGNSNVKIVVSAVAKNGATITATSASCIDGKSDVGSEIELSNVEASTFIGYVTDSRGYSNSGIVIKNMIEYITLSLNPRFYRPQPTENEVFLDVSGNFFNDNFGAFDNLIYMKYRYREVNGIWSEYIDLEPKILENSYSLEISLGSNFDYKKAYEFETIVSDKVIDNISRNETVSEGVPTMALFKEYVEFFGGKTFCKENDHLKLDGSFEIKDTKKTINDIAQIAFLNTSDIQAPNLNDVLTTGLVTFTPETLNNPLEGGYGICLTFVSYTTSYNFKNNWIWQIALDTNPTDPTIHLRNRTNTGNWNFWKRFG